MDRRSFLRALGLTPVALGGLSLLSPEPTSAAKETPAMNESPQRRGFMVLHAQTLQFQGPIDLRGVTKEARVERNRFHLVVYDRTLHAGWPTFPVTNEERVAILDSQITLAIPYGGYALLFGDKGVSCNNNHIYGSALYQSLSLYEASLIPYTT